MLKRMIIRILCFSLLLTSCLISKVEEEKETNKLIFECCKNQDEALPKDSVMVFIGSFFSGDEVELTINNKPVLKNKFTTDPIIGHANYFFFERSMFTGNFCIKKNNQDNSCVIIEDDNNYNYYLIDYLIDVKKIKVTVCSQPFIFH